LLINLKGLGHETDFKFLDKKQAKIGQSTTEHLHHPDNTEQRRKQRTEQSMQPSTAVYAAEDRADALGREGGAANREHPELSRRQQGTWAIGYLSQ
jgi:hypothetical protein